jgi:hypothetical protein
MLASEQQHLSQPAGYVAVCLPNGPLLFAAALCVHVQAALLQVALILKLRQP